MTAEIAEQEVPAAVRQYQARSCCLLAFCSQDHDVFLKSQLLTTHDGCRPVMGTVCFYHVDAAVSSHTMWSVFAVLCTTVVVRILMLAQIGRFLLGSFSLQCFSLVHIVDSALACQVQGTMAAEHALGHLPLKRRARGTRGLSTLRRIQWGLLCNALLSAAALVMG